MQVSSGKFIGIEPESLLPKGNQPFNVFIKINGNYVLYVGDDRPFTQELLEDIKKRNIKKVYIDEIDSDGYQNYLEENITQIVADPSIPTEKKSKIVYGSAVNLMEKVFEHPRSGEIAKSKEFISSTVDFIISDPDSLHNLMGLTSHDYYTYTHSVNVGIFSVALAEKLFGNKSEHNLHELGSAFFLHDIGKCRINPDIIRKEGPLNEEEWMDMKRHPYQGFLILEETRHLSPEARLITMQHHERVNGTGYPQRLQGDKIHIYAKICCIADVFDALTTNRSYRKASSSYEALKIMKKEMSEEFDPDFFATFVNLFRSPTGEFYS